MALIKLFLNYPLFQFGTLVITPLSFFNFILVFCIAICAAKIVKGLLRKRLSVGAGYQFVILRIVSYAVFFLVFLAGLQTLGIDLTSFTVIAGAVGVGIGLGLQSIVNNFFSGLVILSEGLIQIGDRVKVGGIEGYVRNIGARSTVVMSRDNVFMVVPNAEFITNQVSRWGRGDEQAYSLFVQMPIAFGSDIDRVTSVLLDVARSNPHLIKNPSPTVSIDSLAQGYLMMSLNFSTVDRMHQESSLKTELYSAILRRFTQEGISLGHQKIDIAMTDRVQVEVHP